MLTFSRASAYARADFRRKMTVATISTGSTRKTVSARRALMNSRAISTAMNVSTELTMVIRPVCRNEPIASTSVVSRVMIRPVISRS
jgi:hypothetical protein